MQRSLSSSGARPFSKPRSWIGCLVVDCISKFVNQSFSNGCPAQTPPGSSAGVLSIPSKLVHARYADNPEHVWLDTCIFWLVGGVQST
mmetsp:Transcript_101467/g.160447  ORF Transcript_101467/g.160447 Transcript_101467/m.160447 type:complete len:88 (+) Transcript_101467:25-288(+)